MKVSAERKLPQHPDKKSSHFPFMAGSQPRSSSESANSAGACAFPKIRASADPCLVQGFSSAYSRNEGGVANGETELTQQIEEESGMCLRRTDGTAKFHPFNRQPRQTCSTT